MYTTLELKYCLCRESCGSDGNQIGHSEAVKKEKASFGRLAMADKRVPTSEREDWVNTITSFICWHLSKDVSMKGSANTTYREKRERIDK
jgi:hypothetical protein